MRAVKRFPILFAACATLATGAARADGDAAIPVDRFVAAVQAAVAAHPGDVVEADVKRDRGRTIVEVEIVAKDGRRLEVKVDAEKNEVVGWEK